MKNIVSIAVLFSAMMGVSSVSMAKPFSAQLQDQKTQLRPQAFNFYSDRYAQVKAHSDVASKSFATQLESQKLALRPHHFNPRSDAYMQVQAHN